MATKGRRKIVQFGIPGTSGTDAPSPMTCRVLACVWRCFTTVSNRGGDASCGGHVPREPCRPLASITQIATDIEPLWISA